jgi:hypothetical protein
MTKLIHFLHGKFQDLFGSSTTVSCTTRKVNDQFYECKVRKPTPEYCGHSLSSGGGFICKHADRNQFAQK